MSDGKILTSDSMAPGLDKRSDIRWREELASGECGRGTVEVEVEVEEMREPDEFELSDFGVSHAFLRAV